MLIQRNYNMGLLLSRKSFRNKTKKKNIENKQVINARSKNNTPLFSQWIGQLSPVKNSVKAGKSVITENSESFEKYFALTF